MNQVLTERSHCSWLWVRAIKSAYIPDIRPLACARNSFFFRIWGMTQEQIDHLGLYLVGLECCEETRLDKVWGPADQSSHAIDLNHPVYGTRLTKVPR